MSDFLTPKFRALDSNGDPMPGAKLYTYVNGTTTDQTTYQEFARTTAHANPVVADANGYYDPIYLKLNTAYTIALKSSADVQEWSVDDVYGAVLGGDLQTHVYEMADNPMKQGAAGNGTGDDSAELQAAIDAATATRDGVVDLLGRDYNVDATIALKSGLKLQNGSITAGHNGDMFTATGTAGTAASINTTATAVGDNTITVANLSDAGITISDGDIIHVYNNAATSEGELAVVTGVTGASSPTDDTITIAGTLNDVYDTSNGRVSVITPLTDITIRDVTVTEWTSGSSAIFDFDMCKNLTVDNVRFAGTYGGTAVNITRSMDSTVKGCSISNSGTLVSIDEASTNVNVTGNEAGEMGVFVNISATGSVSGYPSNITIANNMVKDCATFIGGTSEYRYLTVSNNVVRCGTGSGGAYIVQDLGQHAVINGNCFHNFGSGIEVSIDGPFSITNNIITHGASSTASVINIDASNEHLGQFVISGNNITVASTGADHVIDINASSYSAHDFSIFGNVIVTSGTTSNTAAVNLTGSSMGNNVTRFSVFGNTIHTNNGGIYIDGYAKNGAITGNVINKTSTAAALNPIKLNVPDVAKAVQTIAITGNVIDGSAQSSVDPIHIVTGSTFAAEATGITITGNATEGHSGSDAIGLNAGFARGITGTSVTGNAGNTGTDFVDVDNGSATGAVAVAGNAGSAFSGSAVSGTVQDSAGNNIVNSTI